jgi:SWIM/SEC-C metal-binding protein
MSKFFYKGKSMKKPDHTSAGFETNKTVRLGTDKAPAKISVQSEERKQELITVFEENGWASIITVASEAAEDVRDLDILLSKKEASAAVSQKQASRNDPCPCGSGKKYKKCCGA